MQKIKLKLNRSLLGHASGAIITLKADSKGIPLDAFWRARLADSKIDSCVQIYSEEAHKPTARRQREVELPVIQSAPSTGETE